MNERNDSLYALFDKWINNLQKENISFESRLWEGVVKNDTIELKNASFGF